MPTAALVADWKKPMSEDAAPAVRGKGDVLSGNAGACFRRSGRGCGY